MPNPNKTIVDRCSSFECNRFLVSYYSSNFIESSLSRIDGLLISIDPKICVAFETWDTVNVFGSRIVLTYVDGKQVARVASSGRLLSGACVLIGFPLKDGSNRMEAERIIKNAASLTRLFFGHNFALDHLATLDFDLASGQTSNTGSGKLIYYLGNRPHEEYDRVFGSRCDGISAKSRTLDLLHQAADSDNRTVRFILYWLAIEVQIGNGEMRRNFCLRTLNSPKINNELERLRVIRNNCLKEGVEVNFSVFDEYSILSIIRIACIKDSKLRNGLKAEYLEALSNPKILV